MVELHSLRVSTTSTTSYVDVVVAATGSEPDNEPSPSSSLSLRKISVREDSSQHTAANTFSYRLGDDIRSARGRWLIWASAG